MDNQQNPEPQSPTVPHSGTQQEIQNTSTHQQEIQPMTAPTSTDVTVSHEVQTPIQPSANVNPNPTNDSHASFSQINTSKPKRHWLYFGLISLVLIAILGFGITLAVDSSLRATVFREKLETYTFVNEHNSKYSFLFYRNSTTQSDNFGSSDRMVLVSPKLKTYVYPIEVSVEGSANNSNSRAQQAIIASNNCTLASGYTKAFSVYISSLKTNANVCTDQGVTYVSEFGTTSSVYYMLFRLKLPSQLNGSQANQVFNGKLNADDLKTIMASFDPL
jgi:hypothetical protein